MTSRLEAEQDAVEEQERSFLAAITEAAAIVPEAIHEEYVRLPVDMATWNHRHAGAQRRAMITKSNLDYVRSIVYLATRERLRALDPKATEAMIAAAVEQDDRVRSAVADDIDAQVHAIRTRGELDALRAKRDMLVSLGAGLRAEWAAIGNRPPQPPGRGG